MPFRFRIRFSTKLILLISLVFLIPVATSLVTLLITSQASIARFDQTLSMPQQRQQDLVREVIPDATPEELAQPGTLLRVMRDYERRRTYGLFVSLIVVSFVLAGVVILLSMLILKRGMLSLHELSLAAARVGEGDFDVSPKCRSHDEFADLVMAFTTMTKRLMETMISRDFYNHVLESMPAAVFTVDNDGLITTWNRQASRLTGLKTGETLGRSIEELTDVVGPRADRASIPFFGREAVVRTRDGLQRIVSKGVDFLYDRDGSHAGVIETFIDISELKKLERQLVIAKERAEGASRLRSEFLANMSHEIRTPLNGIMGLAEIMAEEEKDPERRSNLNTIRQCGGNLLHLINEILELSKLEAGKMVLRSALVSTASVVQEATATIEPGCRRKEIDLGVEVEEEVPDTIEVDGRKLVQILVNLLGNALKFTDQGFIRLRLARYRGERKGDILFEVSDSGRGIPPDRQKLIFESFVQANGYLTRGREGTGLGLTITHKLINLMGGEIWLESEVGKGSVFSFTIESGRPLTDLDRR